MVIIELAIAVLNASIYNTLLTTGGSATSHSAQDKRGLLSLFVSLEQDSGKLRAAPEGFPARGYLFAFSR